MIEWIQACFSNSLFSRLILISLLPNLYVWGFTEVGLNTKSNYIWFHFLEPYWTIEVFLFKTLVVLSVLYFVGSLYFSIKAEILRQRGLAQELEYQRRSEESKRRQAEREASEEQQRKFQAPLQISYEPAKEPPKPKSLTAEEIKAKALQQIVDGF